LHGGTLFIELEVMANEMETLVEAVHGVNYTADKSSGLYLACRTTGDSTYAETWIRRPL